jgi:hypothetical protein
MTSLFPFLVISYSYVIANEGDSLVTVPSKCPEFEHIASNKFAFWSIEICDMSIAHLSWGQSLNQITQRLRLAGLEEALHCQAALDAYEMTFHINEPRDCVTTRHHRDPIRDSEL